MTTLQLITIQNGEPRMLAGNCRRCNRTRVAVWDVPGRLPNSPPETWCSPCLRYVLDAKRKIDMREAEGVAAEEGM